jgi:WhiB family redox-sensing transcriptional regulator
MWQDRALCAETDPEAFYPEKGGSVRYAKGVCNGRPARTGPGNPQDAIAPCPVRAECLAYALEHDERFGIWGGRSERERRRLKREAA